MHKIAAELTRTLGSERVLWEREHLATYGFDGTAALYAEAGCVVLPKTTAEVTQVVRYAAEHKIPVVTRGSGTGLSGGSVPVPGCIVLCSVLMDRVLQLVPQPRDKKTLLATFSQMDAAAETVSAIIAAKIIPCTLEFLDRITMKCVEEYAHLGLPLNAEAILLMETDGHPVVVEEEAQQMAEIARNHGAMAVQLAESAEESIRLTTARRMAFSALARVSPTTILEDATVPRSELANLIRFIQQTAAKYEVTVGTFGHMGDGNLHPTFLTNEKNAAEMARVEKAMEEIFDQAVSLGGTITGEHGVGLAKKRFLPKAIGDASLGLIRQLKRTLDPDNILNPGKIFD